MSNPAQKNQLFTTLTNLGLQQQLKTQIRMQIVQKLKQTEPQLLTKSHEDKLFNRVISSLISEEIVRQGCELSNSVYVAESGYDSKILERGEICQVLGMSLEQIQPKESVLSSLFKRKYPFTGGTVKNMAIQTNPEEVGYTLQQRLALIDLQYRKNLTNNPANKLQVDYKSKINSLQAQLKRTYQRDLQRFKQFQLHALKIKLSQQWRKKFEDYSQKLADQYRSKLSHLRKKQKLLQDDIVNKNKVLDQKVFGTHKTFLQKIQLLDIKSSTVESTRNNLEIQRKRVRDQYTAKQKELATKITQYNNLLLSVNKKIQYQVNIVKLSLQQEQQEKNMQFFNRKKYIDEQYSKLMSIQDTTNIVKQQNKRLYDENIKLRQSLTQIQKQLRIAVSQNSGRNDRLEKLNAEINRLEKEKIVRDQSLREYVNRCKRRQEQLVQIKKEMDQLRNWKQKVEDEKQKMRRSIDSSVLQQQDHEEIPRNVPSASGSGAANKSKESSGNSAKSQIAYKLELLQLQRKKQIQRLKMQL